MEANKNRHYTLLFLTKVLETMLYVMIHDSSPGPKDKTVYIHTIIWLREISSDLSYKKNNGNSN